MIHNVESKAIVALNLIGKGLSVAGIMALVLFVALIKLVAFIFRFIEHNGDATVSDIGAHYNILSGDFDSVKQYDGMYDDYPTE